MGAKMNERDGTKVGNNKSRRLYLFNSFGGGLSTPPSTRMEGAHLFTGFALQDHTPKQMGRA